MREFFIENALHWLIEYHLDGLRLDATHALADDSPEHFLAELARDVARSRRTAQVHLIAEDHRNLDTLLHPARADGGYGLTASGPTTSTTRCGVTWPATTRATSRDFHGGTDEIAGAVR